MHRTDRVIVNQGPYQGQTGAIADIFPDPRGPRYEVTLDLGETVVFRGRELQAEPA